MQIIKIEALENGAHQNQSGNFTTIPDGWAVVPDNMELKNFPFGRIKAEEVDGVMTVTKWIEGVIPEIEPTEEPPSELERLRADIDYIAIMMGVEL